MGKKMKSQNTNNCRTLTVNQMTTIWSGLQHQWKVKVLQPWNMI